MSVSWEQMPFAGSFISSRAEGFFCNFSINRKGKLKIQIKEEEVFWEKTREEEINWVRFKTVFTALADKG